MSEPLRPQDREALDRNIQKTVAGVVIRRLEMISRESQREDRVQTRLFVAALALIGFGLATLALFVLWSA
jgi:uncharacterized membrane protein YqjE